jgi:hypothetical protein
MCKNPSDPSIIMKDDDTLNSIPEESDDIGMQLDFIASKEYKEHPSASRD